MKSIASGVSVLTVFVAVFMTIAPLARAQATKAKPVPAARVMTPATRKPARKAPHKTAHHTGKAISKATLPHKVK